MMEPDDGLSSDRPRLSAASGVGASSEEAKLPIVPTAANKRTQRFDGLQLALDGGDDYELLFAVPREKVARIPRSFRGLLLTKIGKITRRRAILRKGSNNRKLELMAGVFDPFR